MTPREKADAAQQFLDSHVTKQAFVDIREYFVQKLEATEYADEQSRADFTRMLQVLKLFRLQLQKYIQEQTMERHKADQDSAIERLREKYTP